MRPFRLGVPVITTVSLYPGHGASSLSTNAGYIVLSVAEHFGCDESEVKFREDDDGCEYVEVRGETVGVVK